MFFFFQKKRKPHSFLGLNRDGSFSTKINDGFRIRVPTTFKFTMWSRKRRNCVLHVDLNANVAAGKRLTVHEAS